MVICRKNRWLALQQVVDCRINNYLIQGFVKYGRFLFINALWLEAGSLKPHIRSKAPSILFNSITAIRCKSTAPSLPVRFAILDWLRYLWAFRYYQGYVINCRINAGLLSAEEIFNILLLANYNC